MEKVAILDYASGTVHILNIHCNSDEIEDELTDLGFSINNIHYMLFNNLSIDLTDL